VLDGGEGNDIYVIDAGDGVDTIVDNAGENYVILFGAGVDPAQIKLFKGSLGLDLGNGQQVHIDGVDYDDLANTSGIQYFEFADGGTLDLPTLLERGFDIVGGAGDDTLQGTSVTDRIDGGAGNDLLRGGAGDDRYYFGPGDGSDRIEDTQGNDSIVLKGGTGLRAERSGDDLVLSFAGGGDALVVAQWYTQTAGVGGVVLADGTALDRTGIAQLMNQPPVANPDTVVTDEDAGTVSVAGETLLANDADTDAGDVLAVTAVSPSTAGATVTLEDGRIQYPVGDVYQSLGEGQTVTDSFSYTVADRAGASSQGIVQVIIEGANDAPRSQPVADVATPEDAPWSAWLPAT
jgi:VCBS repeat-containing protein